MPALKQQLHAKLAPYSQQHLLGFWPRLSEPQRLDLARQIERLDFARLDEMRQAINLLRQPALRELSSAAVVELADGHFPYQLGDEAEAARPIGERALREGQVACLLVAGGQGTRLGFSGPKGCYPLLPLSQMTLFEIFARKLLRVGRIYGRVPPLYVMLSRQNDSQTRDFFAQNKFFGLDAKHVHFFVQGEMPSLDNQGKLVLEAPHTLFLGPDGHGGVLEALNRSGCLKQMQDAGIATISYFQVDNAQAPVVDAAFIGLHLTRQAEVSLKVVRKEDPAERVGIFCNDRGVPQIVEYTEFSDAQSHLHNANGLAYWAGSIAVHLFSVSFLANLAKRGIDLPLHAAHKKVTVLDVVGNFVEAASPNVYRFERFIFDVLPLAKSVVALEVPREEQFLPLKNASGPFGPEGVRQSQQQYWRKALRAAGLPVTQDLPPMIEVDPLLAENARDLIEHLKRQPHSGNIDLSCALHLRA